MRSNLIEVFSPSLDQNLGFLAASKPFQAQTFIAEFVIEALIGGILPRLARVDERRIDVSRAEPL